jgi:hypothetical protein
MKKAFAAPHNESINKKEYKFAHILNANRPKRNINRCTKRIQAILQGLETFDTLRVYGLA